REPWLLLIEVHRHQREGSWWLTANASVIYTNPEGIVPGDLEELTWLSVQRRMKTDTFGSEHAASNYGWLYISQGIGS
ncbi:hypothetical protein Q6284_33930, partial [Klebsiella pneumoniae]|nr:hypothetical protein [Klebsiella pneumoniae]